MKMTNATLAGALLAALAISPAALAEKTGFYFGVDAGSTSVDLDKGNLDEAFAFVTDNFLDEISSDVDDSDTGWDLKVGYRFMPYLAVEAAYLDLGGATYNATSIYAESADISVESSGFATSILGILPVAENFEVFARVGMYFGDTEVSGHLTDYFGDTYSDSASESEQEMLWGVGAGYNFGQNWGIHAEYTTFVDIGEDDLTAGESDVERMSLGLTYSF